MPYCITLRSRTDAKITGWYAGSKTCRWSTDHNRRKRFDNPHEASAVCQELRNLCPRNAAVIKIEVTQDDRQPSGVTPKLGQGRRGELDREKPMKSDVLLHGHLPADYRREQISRPNRVEDQKNSLLNPLVGWSIALLMSTGLWWSIGVAVSSVVRVVL